MTTTLTPALSALVDDLLAHDAVIAYEAEQERQDRQCEGVLSGLGHLQKRYVSRGYPKGVFPFWSTVDRSAP